MSKKSYDNLIFEFDNEQSTAKITINRPDKLNALNADLLNELEDLFYELHQRGDIRGAYITGAGDKAFVAGADIKELTDLNSFRGTVTSERGQEVFQIIENSPFPVIAVIGGFTLGGGLELALACHMRVASENAVFGLPEVGLGLIPGYGGTQRLPRLIGESRATEMILTGNQIKADLALAYGLVNRMVAKGEEMNEAESLMKSILQNAPLAVRNALKTIKGAFLSPEEGYRREAESFGELCGSNDFKEGTSAFLEKRKPEFTGH